MKIVISSILTIIMMYLLGAFMYYIEPYEVWWARPTLWLLVVVLTCSAVYTLHALLE